MLRIRHLLPATLIALGLALPADKAFGTAAPKAAAQKKDAAGPAAPKKKPATAKPMGEAPLKSSAPKAEDGSLPDYPIGARIAMGKQTTYKAGEEDTFLDIARHFSIGYVELRAANPIEK